MTYATRINSFLTEKGNTISSALREISNVQGVDFVDLNYPEHFRDMQIEQMQALLQETGVNLNGIALRFDDFFCNGEFTNADPRKAEKALQLCLEALDVCRALGGKVVTVWQAYDAFDYPFQMPYARAWQQMKQAITTIADAAAPDLLVSIEYKPYQPRSFSLLPNMASTLLMVTEVGRPNLGITLDFCHMLMAGENPAQGADIVGSRGKLFGVHLNDGYRLNDDGLMIGAVHPLHTMEFLYYAKKHGYNHALYFDTFPVRENAAAETAQNIRTTNALLAAIERIGMEKIEAMIGQQNGLNAMTLLEQFMQ